MDKNEFTVLNPTSVSARQKHHNFDNFNIDEEFRSFNIFTPKIYISIKTTLRTTLSKVQQSYDQKNTIASAEINSLNNNIKQSDLKYKTFKKTNTFKPNIRFFFETKSKEYHFQDISEKSKNKEKKNTKVYKAFKKLLDENNNQLYYVSARSPILKHYHNLLRLEESIVNPEFDELRIREDDLIYDQKDEEDKTKKHSKAVNGSSKIIISDPKINDTTLLNNFKNWFYEEVKTLKSDRPKPPSLQINTKSNLETQTPTPITAENPETQEANKNKSVLDISNYTFGIHFRTLIDKAIRLSHNYHQRLLLIEGPIVNWFRYKENQTKNILKGTFDLRKTEIKKDDNTANISNKDKTADIFNKDKTEINKVDKNNNNKEDKTEIIKENKKEEDKWEIFTASDTEPNLEGIRKRIKFRSELSKTISNKSICHIFDHIKNFYNLLIHLLKNNYEYKKLQYISDPKITKIEIGKEDKLMIDNLNWHIRLKIVHLKLLDKTNMNRFFLALIKSNEIKLEIITIESNKNSFLEFEENNSNPWVKNMRIYFNSECCLNLEELHMVDIKIPKIKNILDILEKKFDIVKNKIDQDKESNSNYNPFLDNKLPKNPQTQEKKLPFTKLSFRNSRDNYNSSSFNNSNIPICLNELYDFFNKMLNKFENKHDLVFECLDISGMECSNIEGLNGIINNFKFIKELNISGTKLIEPLEKDLTNKVVLQKKILNNVIYLVNSNYFIKNINPEKKKESSKTNNENSSVVVTPSNVTNSKNLNIINNTNIDPILSTLYIWDTPVSQMAYTELLNLFTRLKYMKAIHLTENLINFNSVEHFKLVNALSEIKKEDDKYCENYFEVEYTYNDNGK